jgi:TfoX/Sxy family transcriptional regulator of competence genes
MAYDEKLAERLRDCLADRSDVAEKKMFGGLVFMVRGHMACGVMNDQLMLKLDDDAYEAALARPHARPMDLMRRPMKGMVYVVPAGWKTLAALRSWVALATRRVESLPMKKRPPR